MRYLARSMLLFAIGCGAEPIEEGDAGDTGKADIFTIGTSGQTIEVDGFIEWPVELELAGSSSDSTSFECGGWLGLEDCDLIVELVVPFENGQVDDLMAAGFLPELPAYIPFIVGAVLEIDLPDNESITYHLSINYDYDANDGTYYFAWSRDYSDWDGASFVAHRNADFGSRVEDYVDGLAAGEVGVTAYLHNGMPMIDVIARIAWR